MLRLHRLVIYFRRSFCKGELYQISLESGWNMIGYLNETESIEIIFNDLVSQGALRLVKDSDGNIYLPGGLLMQLETWNWSGIR